jgi:L-alanine-DL-glutamate epimerase-like enolase superfamily enzyme
VVLAARRSAVDVRVERLEVSAYTIPTHEPESDGTLEWDSTTIVVVHAHADGASGLGYTYADAAAARLIESLLAGVVESRDATAVSEAWVAAGAALRNTGRPGLGAMALSAVDVALWDLKARVLDLPLVDLLDRVRDEVPVYGSGGFTSYPPAQVADQLGAWVALGIPRVKMKVGREPELDAERLDAARNAIDDAELYVDANGAYDRRQALVWAERFAREWGVTWLEEPVSSADLDGLRFVRDRGPAGLEVAAGEYGFVLRDFVNLLDAGAVDCLQADVTRCGGITGLLQVAALCDAYAIDLSGHCAPQISAHALACVPRLRHLEYFHDHVRVERLLFDGCLDLVEGSLRPDRSRPGHGLTLRREDVERYAA